MNRKLLNIQFEDVSGTLECARYMEKTEFDLSGDPEKVMDIPITMHNYPYKQWGYSKPPFTYRFGFYIKESDYATLSKIISTVIKEQTYEQDFKVREISEYVNRELCYMYDIDRLHGHVNKLKEELLQMNYQCVKCRHTFEQETAFGHKPSCCPKCRRADWNIK